MAEQEEKFTQEKRRAPRVSGALVEYTFEKKDAPTKTAFIKDICIYGICIFVPETVELGAIMCLDIFLFGDYAPIKTKGKVLWQKQGGDLGYYNVGIEFTNINPEYAKILSEYIKINTQKS
jgi:hypothetical protein